MRLRRSELDRKPSELLRCKGGGVDANSYGMRGLRDEISDKGGAE